MALRTFGELFAEVHGNESPTVVALHGWGRRGADFSMVLDGLDALAFDLPGFGATPQPERVLSTEAYAEMVAQALESLPQAARTIVGHSFGGRVAVRLAAGRPELVDRLVLTGVPLVRLGTRKRPPLGYRMVRGAHRLGLVPDERMERVRQRRGSADYRAASGVMRQILVATINESYDDDLGRIHGPVDLVWGAEDADVPPEVARRVHRRLMDRGVQTSIEVLDDVGHLVPSQAPDALRRVIVG